jgi:hypothetical protein
MLGQFTPLFHPSRVSFRPRMHRLPGILVKAADDDAPGYLDALGLERAHAPIARRGPKTISFFSASTAIWAL